MQDEVNEKTIALYIKTGKLTAQTLQKAMKAILSKGKKELSKPPQGKQSLKQLMKQNAGVSNIEITKDNIKAFESTAKKYGIDFALKKDTTETPPRCHGNKPCELVHEDNVRTDNRYPLRAHDRNLPLLFGIAYPVRNND